MKEKIIAWGDPIFDVKTGKSIDYRINSLHVDQFDQVCVSIQKGTTVKIACMTMEHAQEIGFIDFSKLQQYCK